MKQALEKRERTLRTRMRKAPAVIKTDVLEFLPYQYKGQPITITIHTDEFTSVCPMTGLPDFGRVVIRYVPDKTIVELKSLKYYLFQYREVGIFYEHLVNCLLDDLWSGLKPRSLTVEGIMTPRGGITTSVQASRER